MNDSFFNDLEEPNNEKKENNEDINTEIENNIKSYITYGKVIQVLISIAAIILALMCFTDEDTVIIGIIILVGGLLTGFITGMIIRWFGYTLKCLFDIRNSQLTINNHGNTQNDKTPATTSNKSNESTPNDETQEKEKMQKIF